MPPLTPLAAATLALFPALVFAEENRQETRLPPVAWEQSFMGFYAPDGECRAEGPQWVLTEFSVATDEYICNGMGKMTWEADGLVVPLSDCLAGARPVDPRILVFARTEDGLRVMSADSPPLDLTRCPTATN